MPRILRNLYNSNKQLPENFRKYSHPKLGTFWMASSFDAVCNQNWHFLPPISHTKSVSSVTVWFQHSSFSRICIPWALLHCLLGANPRLGAFSIWRLTSVQPSVQKLSALKMLKKRAYSRNLVDFPVQILSTETKRLKRLPEKGGAFFSLFGTGAKTKEWW